MQAFIFPSVGSTARQSPSHTSTPSASTSRRGAVMTRPTSRLELLVRRMASIPSTKAFVEKSFSFHFFQRFNIQIKHGLSCFLEPRNFMCDAKRLFPPIHVCY